MEFMFQLELCGLTTRTFYALTLASLESMEVLYNVLIVTNTWNSNMDKLPRSHCPDMVGWGFNSQTQKVENSSPCCFECNGGL